MWWLHDGLSPRRKEHPRHELPVLRRKARRAGFSRNSRGGCAATRRHNRRQRRVSGFHREVHSMAKSPSATASLAGRCLRRFRARNHGVALPPEGQAIASQPEQPGRPICSHQFRVADRRASPRDDRRLIERCRDWLRRLHRRAHAHRSRPLSQRLGCDVCLDHHPDRRPARTGTGRSLAQEPYSPPRYFIPSGHFAS